MKSVQIGSPVKVVDEVGVEHDAIATATWGANPAGMQEYDDSEGKKVFLAINVVFVSADPEKTDCYGRQTEHLSSVAHRSSVGECPGRYWWQP